MGTFDWHSDVNDLPVWGGPDGLVAFGLWVRSGCWTSANGRTGVVPNDVASALSGGDDAAIAVLVDAGLWEPTREGYRMLRGPSSGPDQPLPIWRYSDGDTGGRLFARDDAPDT